MSDLINELSSVSQFTPARRIALYNQLQPELDQRGLTRLSSYVDRARAHEHQTVKLDTRWDAQTERHKYSADLSTIDPAADRMVFAVHDTAQAHADTLLPGDPLAGRIAKFVADVFPSGPAAITTRSYLEQIAAMEVCVDALVGTYAPLMLELGMTSMVERLAAMTAAYRDAVDGGHGRLLFADVSTQRERGHIYLLEIIAMIISAYHDSDSPVHVRERTELLALVRKHDAQERQERRIRRQRTNAGSDADVPADTDTDTDTDADGEAPSDTGDDAPVLDPSAVTAEM